MILGTKSVLFVPGGLDVASCNGFRQKCGETRGAIACFPFCPLARNASIDQREKGKLY